MPSVMQTISGTSASIASRIASAGEGRRHVDHAGIGARRLHAFRHRVEDRQADMRGAALARRHPAHIVRAVGDALLGVEGALRRR